MSAENYDQLNENFIRIKDAFWKDKKVIFHSRDIRKCEKEFKILLNNDIKQQFYKELDNVISTLPYTVIASIIDKDQYVKKYGKLKDDVYEIALSFLVERAVFFLDDLKTKASPVYFILEERGKKEDLLLKKHFETLKNKGTYYVTPERLNSYDLKIEFRNKKQNVNGLQLSDLVAYPIARYSMDKERANPAFDIIRPKIYSKGSKTYGLKFFP